jgi:hypothetical protein
VPTWIGQQQLQQAEHLLDVVAQHLLRRLARPR